MGNAPWNKRGILLQFTPIPGARYNSPRENQMSDNKPDNSPQRQPSSALAKERTRFRAGWNRLVNTPEALSVSYTHLDVYKRQGLGLIPNP